MNTYAIAKRIDNSTAVIATEYGTFDSVDAAAEYIVCELLADPQELQDGKSMYYITMAAA